MLESGWKGPSLGSQLLTANTGLCWALCSEPHVPCGLGLRCALPSRPALSGECGPRRSKLQATVGPNPLLHLDLPGEQLPGRDCSRPLCLVFGSPPVRPRAPPRACPRQGPLEFVTLTRPEVPVPYWLGLSPHPLRIT